MRGMVRENALVGLAAERTDQGLAGQILLAGQVNNEMSMSNGRNPAVLLKSYPTARFSPWRARAASWPGPACLSAGM